MRFKSFAVAFACVSCLTASALAHHSHGNYDVQTWTTMEGTVKQVIFIVPHSIVYLDVKGEKGDTTTWSLEATNPQGIFLKGVKKEDVMVGDKIKVRCHLLRDGGKGCLLGFVTPIHGDKARGDGVEIEWD
ncbi:MAG TPA: DUF6152 family protein [Vicinamibacterales bacterium]|nr:DUF6152 family protein [Vicinamibacterales bacterium]